MASPIPFRGPKLEHEWTRTRFFIGHCKGREEVFQCWYMPRSTTHGHLYNYVMGPYRFRHEAEVAFSQAMPFVRKK